MSRAGPRLSRCGTRLHPILTSNVFKTRRKDESEEMRIRVGGNRHHADGRPGEPARRGRKLIPARCQSSATDPPVPGCTQLPGLDAPGAIRGGSADRDRTCRPLPVCGVDEPGGGGGGPPSQVLGLMVSALPGTSSGGGFVPLGEGSDLTMALPCCRTNFSRPRRGTGSIEIIPSTHRRNRRWRSSVASRPAHAGRRRERHRGRWRGL